MNLTICKIENCDAPIRTKKLNMCQKHETRFRNHGDPNYKTQYKSLIPLIIPGGEIISNYQKAKKIMAIISTLEKMIMCGHVTAHHQLQNKAFKLINTRNNREYFENYIIPLLKRKKCWELLEYAEEILKVVDEIIDNDKCPRDKFMAFSYPKLDSFGIIVENNEFVFKETQRELSEKVAKLGIDHDNMEEFEFCYQLQMHQRRYDRMTS